MNTPRELAEKIIGGEDAWVDTDAQTVAQAYLELCEAVGYLGPRTDEDDE